MLNYEIDKKLSSQNIPLFQTTFKKICKFTTLNIKALFCYPERATMTPLFISLYLQAYSQKTRLWKARYRLG